MFDVNAASLDWLTVTTYNPILSQKVLAHMRHMNPQTTKDLGEQHRLQYLGQAVATARGTVFAGTGKQANGEHYMFQASGSIADNLFLWTKTYLKSGLARATRVDLQITVDYPRDTWSQTDYMAALRDSNPDRVISYEESCSGPAGTKLGTIYYYARTNTRFYRIYEKVGMSSDPVVLRFEVEYKFPLSQVVVGMLTGGAPPSGILKFELTNNLPDAYGGQALFLAPLINADSYPVRTIKPEPRTEKWLRESCIPSLFRILNDHDANHHEVAEMFQRVLTDYYRSVDNSNEMG